MDQINQEEWTEESELAGYQAENIETVEQLDPRRALSILESLLFMSDRPVGLSRMEEVFAGTQIDTKEIHRLLEQLKVRYQDPESGVYLEEVAGGYQLRTKLENHAYLKKQAKHRLLRLSDPALEVLAIVAYKQPIIKAEIDEIRGVDSGHLLRALMEKGLVKFGEKSDLPGRPMFYETTKRFLEVVGLRNLKELPTLSQIEELLPEGIDEMAAQPSLAQVGEELKPLYRQTYSEAEEELEAITFEIRHIEVKRDQSFLPPTENTPSENLPAENMTSEKTL